MTKELVNKFELGDHLTDNECKELLKFFTELSDSLELMGEGYRIAWYPIYLNKNKVRDYLYARGLIKY